jgi:hypothetical protein
MIRLALVGALVALAACSAQMADDFMAGPEARCDRAAPLYDEAPGVWVGVLTAASCAG